jgi:hypothetical protein
LDVSFPFVVSWIKDKVQLLQLTDLIRCEQISVLANVVGPSSEVWI